MYHMGSVGVKRHILHFYYIEDKSCIKCILSDFGYSGTLLKCDLSLIALSVPSCSMVIAILRRQVTLTVFTGHGS